MAWLYMIGFWWIRAASAQGLPDLRFSHLTDRDGLSNNNVTAVAQDRDGIIWIGTQNGLDRFDGYGFRNFYAASGSIPSNFISQIVPGRGASLWVTTTEGVFHFDTHTQQSQAFRSVPGDTGTFREQYRPSLYLDSAQLPWVATRDGLYHFRDSIHYERRPEGLENTKARFSVLVSDGNGRLWSWYGHYLYRLGPSLHLDRTLTLPPEAVVRNLLFDSYGHTWVCTWGKGIYLLDTARGSLTAFHPSAARSVVYGAVEWTLVGRKYAVFCTSAPSLFFVDEQTMATYEYPFDPEVGTLGEAPPFVDRQGILWVTSTNGIYYATPSNDLFSVLPVGPTPSHPSFVYNIREEPSGYWVAKRPGGGIFWYDRHWGLRKAWPHLPTAMAKEGLFPPSATATEGFDFLQKGDTMYVTTEGGLSILDLRTFHWTTLAPGGLRAEARLRTIVVENERTWWIRSFSQGVFVFDPLTRRFTRHYEGGFPSEINYLIRSPDGRILVTTNGGLFTYDRPADTFRKINLQGPALPSNNLFGMALDRAGLLWVGAENGLFVVDPGTGTVVKAFSENTQIGIVYRLCTDGDQNVWFTGNTGYWCWLRHSDKVVHFEYSIGLPQVDECTFYETGDGLVYGGGQDAVVRFYPDRLRGYQVQAGTKIVEAVVNDTPAVLSMDREGQKQLVLSPGENSLQVGFDVINYDLLSTNQYFYRLSPGNKDWQQSPTGRLYFYNLQAGTYTLEVRGSSKLTGQFTNTDSLKVLVRPYWYRSDWFKFVCILAAGAGVLLLVRYRIRTVRRESALQQKMTEIEMSALRAQMNPHFIFNSLNSIENFIMQNEKRLASDYLNKFATLIRLILENSRKPSVSVAQDMEAIQLYVDLERLRFDGKFGYVPSIDRALLDGDYRVAPLLIQPFVENAILHGLAPSDKKGLHLWVSARLQEDYIRYVIEDNGIGRTASMAYNRRRKIGHKSLGLEISRERISMINEQQGTDGVLEIVDLHDVDQRPAGTRVILTLKIT